MKKKLFGRFLGMALAGVMLVSAVPAFAEDFVIEEDVSVEEESMPEAAQDAETVTASEDVFDDVLIEDMDVVEAKNMYGDGKLWYSTRIGSFSDGTNSVYYYHSYPSSIGGWDEIPKTDDTTKEFLGYSLEENGEIISLPFNFEEAGTELFAVWGSNVTYKITLDANGGKFINSDTSTSLTCKDGTVLDMAYELEDGILPTPTGGPGDFLGYSDTPDGKPLTSYTVSGNATLYAVWEDYADCEHDWKKDEAQSVPATCTTDGKDVYICSKCNAFEERTVKATGHSFGEWVVTREATVDAEGEKTRTCACGATETEVIPKLEPQNPSGPVNPGTEDPQNPQNPSSEQPAQETPKPVVQKTRSISGPNAVAKGKKITLTLVNREKSVSWKTSNKKVATVTSGGVVKGKKKGKVTITATENGKSYKFTVNVIDPKLNRKSATVKVRKSVKLKVKNAKGAPVQWKSSKPSVAAVSADGRVTALKKGSCKITAIVGGKKLTCKIKVRK